MPYLCFLEFNFEVIIFQCFPNRQNKNELYRLIHSTVKFISNFYPAFQKLEKRVYFRKIEE